MADTALEALIHSVSVVFVLSLAVERIAAFFKRRDWQPLDVRQRFQSKNKSRVRVDLSTGKALTGKGLEVELSPGELKGRMSAANAENTLLIGVALAFATGANAFSAMPGMSEASLGFVPTALEPMYKGLLTMGQVVLTGAAAGVGSSFWYDLLGLLGEIRRARAQATTHGSPPSSEPAGRPLPPEADDPNPFALAMQAALAAGSEYRELQQAAQLQLPRLEEVYGKNRVKVVEVPRTTEGACFEFQVALDDGMSLKTPTWPIQVPSRAQPYDLPLKARRPR